MLTERSLNLRMLVHLFTTHTVIFVLFKINILFLKLSSHPRSLSSVCNDITLKTSSREPAVNEAKYIYLEIHHSSSF